MSPPVASPNADTVRTAASIAVALGGAGHIASAQVCALTRVRVTVVDPALVNDAGLRDSSVTGVMRPAANVLHLIVGPQADGIATAVASGLRT